MIPSPLAAQEPAFSVGGLIHQLAVWACAMAIASVPILSSNPSWSIFPQLLALGAAGMAGLTLLEKLPRIHPALLAYGGLLLLWGWTLLWDTGLWQNYRTLLKISILALTVHVVIRSREDLLLLLGVFCAGGFITLMLNWGELRHLGSAIGSSDLLSEKDRFAGTFGNANSAGMYGVMVLLCGLILFFNGRTRLRWVLLAIGLVAGAGVCYFSGSRKAMLGLGLITVGAPWMIAMNSKTGRVQWSKAMGLTAALLLLGVLAVGFLPFMDRLLVPFKEGFAMEHSSRMRLGMIIRAFELWTDHPIFGCGFDGFSRYSGYGVYSHTTFGEALCNGGLVGLLLLGIFYVLPAAHLAGMVMRDFGSPGSRLGLGLLIFWAIFTLFSCFAVMFDSREYLALYAAVCGYVQANRPASRRQEWLWQRWRHGWVRPPLHTTDPL